MTPADLSRLESLAREATPGPWEKWSTYVWSPIAKAVIAGASELRPTHGCVGYTEPKLSNIEGPAANAAYIAAANPAAVLALIERVRELEADAGRFLHLANEASIHGAMGERFYLEWHGQGVDIRDAIDAAMKEDKP